MPTVHVFCSAGRFRSFDEMRLYIDEAYCGGGDGEPSAFMTEVGLDEYEPMAIEAVPSNSGHPVPLAALLTEASFADQWLSKVDGGRLADAAICVYPPNEMAHPEGYSLEYIGAFEYR